MTFVPLTMAQRARLGRRSHLAAAVRAYFVRAEFLEVDTPVAIAAPAPEPYIDAVAVIFQTHQGPRQRFLQTSPELAMKRLIAGGLGKIFQIAPCFRDNDFTAWHRPEFRLLEWYRPTARYLDLVDDAMGLIRFVLAALGLGPALRVAGQSVDVARDPIVMTVEDIFEEHAGLRINELHQLKDFQNALRKRNEVVDPEDSWSDLFHRVFLDRIEPFLRRCDRPVFLKEFPKPLAALAKLCPEREHVAERVELYVRGIELANGFGELTQKAEQRGRFGSDNAERARLGKTVYPLDEAFLSAVGHMPATAGMALGMDRLHMLIEDASNLDEVAFIPWT